MFYAVEVKEKVFGTVVGVELSQQSNSIYVYNVYTEYGISMYNMYMRDAAFL